MTDQRHLRRPAAERAECYAAAETEAQAAVAALNSTSYGDEHHDDALGHYHAARVALGAREMLEEAERQRPGALAYGGAQAETDAPPWYRELLEQSALACPYQARPMVTNCERVKQQPVLLTRTRKAALTR